jgi:hypothetical protein
MRYLSFHAIKQCSPQPFTKVDVPFLTPCSMWQIKKSLKTNLKKNLLFFLRKHFMEKVFSLK